MFHVKRYVKFGQVSTYKSVIYIINDTEHV